MASKAKAGRKPRPAKDPNAPAETKRARFVRLCKARMGKTLKSISTIANLASRSSYEYTDDDVTKMEAALTEAVSDAIAPFKVAKKDKGAPSFDIG